MSARNSFGLGLGVALAILTACGGDPPVVHQDGGMEEDAASPTTCSDGTTMCGTTCVDTDEARAHCGGCDNACAAGEACVDGTCDLLCPASQTECDGACADTTRDAAHCGDCDTACAAGEVCVAGECELSCPAGQIACDGACADTESDPAHCGECGEACAAGAVCSGGECTTSCGAGLTECSGACVDTASHPDHCGGCDTACTGATGASGFCSGGTCRASCGPLVGDCNADLGASGSDGCETPLATDAENCGACGRACEYPQAIGGCAAGECVFAGCETGFDDCDGELENGCETELAESELHCGACGSVCATGERCYGGTCAPIGGEDCSDAIALSVGANLVHWTAERADYMTHGDLFSCSTTQPRGPDVVMAYTATATELVTVSVTKPNTERWTMMVTSTCGDLTTDLACASATGTTGAPITELAFEPLVMGAGETIFIHLTDTTAGVPLTNPLEVEVISTPAPCAPGIGGIIGTDVARIALTQTSMTEQYVAVDERPDGYVYVGGTTTLYRTPKAGGTAENVVTLAGLTASHLGYAMLVDGDDIYTVESTTSTTTTSGRLFRISTDGGATWAIQDYAFFPSAPTDDIRSITRHDDTLYLLTEEDTATVATQIWAVPAEATTLPAVATLVTSISGESDCMGMARDASFFYLACVDAGDRIIRVPVTGGTPTLVTDRIALSTTVNVIVGDDTNGDGTFDVLYVHGEDNRIDYVCGPSTATPFVALLRAFDTAVTTNYGMAFDAAGGVLWSFDDDTREYVSIQ